MDRQIDQDRVFFALADPGRRRILGRLSLGPMTVSELARWMEMSLPLLMQHVAILESGALAVTEKQGRVRTCRVDKEGFRFLEQWLNNHRLIWEMKIERLHTLVEEGEGTKGLGD